MSKFLPTLALFAIVLINIYTPTYAENPSPSQEIPSFQTTGRVLKVEDGRLVINSDSKILEYNIPPNIRITQNNLASDLRGLSPNDKVTIVQANDGEILALNSLSGQLVDAWKWLLPIALSLIGIGLFSIIFKRINQKPDQISQASSLNFHDI